MYTEPQANLQIQEIVRLATSYIPSSKLDEFEKDLQDYYSSIQIRTVPHRNFGQNLVYYPQASHISRIWSGRIVTWEEALRLSCRPLLMPQVQAVVQGLALVGAGEVHHGGGAAPAGPPGSRW